ncbi:glycosyltransferase family 4 protein [Corynebacterium sp. TA-R-1]|uniref:Glycosyltransferase family 4 protein n=1 Tax=Corynebacterium stercoris TaxID=2943490 RepID=A0ABT1G0L0_9CORY|nr:glycosyltransferase family 4 protein [Corynebacterium stercoris]MCP1387564.1 glycosyltransferase family 4 protein [Corynebacterium stercoris]
MKILLLCWRDSTHPQGGGSERYLERVGEYLAAQGHDVVYRTAKPTDAPRRSTRGGIRYERAGGKYGVYLLAPLAIWRHRPDVIVDTQNGIPFFARLFTRRPVVLLTHHCHREQWPVAGPLIGRLGWFLESRVAPRVYRGAPYVTVSEASRRDLVRLGVREADITIVPNGVDPVPPAPVLADDGLTHLITLSRLVPHKRLELAVDAVAELDGCVLDVVGSGWWEDKLRAYVAERGVADRVVFHGHVAEDHKHALLARAAVHLMPSRKEGWGIAVIEAAQHGVPTVAFSDAGGVNESIRDFETGRLVAAGEDFTGVVAELVRELSAEPGGGWALSMPASPMPAAAREWAATFSWEETGRRFADVLARAAGSRAAGSRVAESR